MQAPRLTAHDFDQELLILFDAYVHGGVDRRGFLERAQKFAVGGATAAGLLAALSPNWALGQVVKPDDKRVQTQWIEYDSPKGSGKAKGYLARPANASGPLPTVIVVHENRGVNPHIEDIARRLALDGYLAFAPEALSPLGGYPGDEDKAREMFARLDMNATREDFIAGTYYARNRPDSNKKVGAVGFCWGGGMVHQLAANVPELVAGVPFYGNVPASTEARKVKADLLLNFAENDDRINSAWPGYEAALKTAGVKYTAYKYPGTQHGFNNDTTPRFDTNAAKLAWSRTMEFFGQKLKA